LKVYNPSTDLLDPGSVVRVSPPENPEPDAFVECSIEHVTRAPDGWIVQLAGVDDRDSAEELRGAELWVSREELPPPGDDEFYIVDAPGYSIVDDRGTLIGRVIAVETYPTADVLVVEREGGGRVEIPGVPGVLVGVEHAEKRLVVDHEVIAGLLGD
jgi:16S rRNA processing protein RimM